METAISIKYNKEAQIAQANKLIRSRQDDLTLVEAKLIRLAISQITQLDNELRTYSCQITELAEHLDIAQDNLYRDIEKIGVGIMKKSIHMKDTNSPPKKNGEYNYIIFNWVDYFCYSNGVITLRLNEKLKPFLLGLNEHFTKYGYSNIISLPTSNSIRLLELLTSYESLVNPYENFPQYNTPYIEVEKAKNELAFTIDFLRTFFNCIDKYPLTADFIKRVIAASVKAINTDSTTHRVSYRVVKTGRSISHVLFKVNAWGDDDFKEFINKEV